MKEEKALLIIKRYSFVLQLRLEISEREPTSPVLSEKMLIEITATY